MTVQTEALSGIIGRGLASARPTAGIAGRLYYATDTSTLSRDNGTSWDTLPTGSALAVEEVDASPTDAAITKIVFPNGTLSIVGHVATYTPSGGALTIKNEGTTLGSGTDATTLDFIGSGVDATGSGATKTITINGATGFIGCRVYNSSAIATNPSAALTFDSERFDSDGFHSTSVNPSRITIPAGLGGKYTVSAAIEWAPNSTGYRQIGFRVNGTTYIGIDIWPAVTGGGETRQVITSPPWDFVAGDYVEVIAAQTSGGSLNVTAGAAYSPEFAIVKLDSGKVGQGIGAKAYRSTTQAFGAGTVAASYDSEDFDTDGFHEGVTNPTRMTIPAGLGGKYLVVANWYRAIAGASDVWLRVNGTTNVRGSYATVSSTSAGLTLSAVVDLVAGDYIESVTDAGTATWGHASSSRLQLSLSVMRLDSGSGVQSGALILLEQHIASSSATLDFTAWRNDARYDDYEIHLIDILPATNATDLWLRVSTDSGATYAATNYQGSLHYAYSGGTGISGASSTLAFQISDSVSNVAAGGGWYGRVLFTNPGAATYKRFLARGQMYHGTISNTMVFTEVMGMWNTTTAIDAIRIMCSSGNITSGTVRIYGIAK